MDYKRYYLDEEGLEIDTQQVDNGIVKLEPNVDLAYLMRNDFVVLQPVADKIADSNNIDKHQVYSVLLEQYDIFTARTIEILLDTFKGEGRSEVHLYDFEALEASIRARLAGASVISLDPLVAEGVENLRLSRGYFLSGKKTFGQVAKPEDQSVEGQLASITDNLRGATNNVVLLEDDVFTGGSLAKTVDLLGKSEIVVDKVVVGIQVGHQNGLKDRGVKLEAGVTYIPETPEGNIFDKIDLGDPRDFCLGLSGLVVKLPNGGFGRAPYILPFIDVTKRTNVPESKAKAFSQDVLKLNLDFWKQVQAKTGKIIKLRDLDAGFIALMHEVYGVDINTNIVDVCQYLLENSDNIWGKTVALGQLQEQLVELNLPQRTIFLDVNGTLLPSDAKSSHIDPAELDRFRGLVVRLKEQGIEVGLNSDSPLPELLQFSNELGLSGPIIAENGNLIHYNSKTAVLNTLEDLLQTKVTIQQVAARMGYIQSEDCVAVEFGGVYPDFSSGRWAFGANRDSSVTVFGSPDLVQALSVPFKDGRNVSVDASPQFHFFAVHPDNYRQNKTNTLRALRGFGYDVVMVGDSRSDWIDPESGVRCAFVGNNSLSNEERAKASFVSNQSHIKGVIDILEKQLSVSKSI